MDYQNKKILFQKFLSKWESQFKKVTQILRILNTYPEVSNKFFRELLDSDNLHESQLEWVSLVHQFDNPIEKRFFKEYFVPIQQDGYDFYIDLSTNTFSIFNQNYFHPEPCTWFKNFVATDINQFLLEIGSKNYDVDSHYEKFHKKGRVMQYDLIEKRDELGLAGKINLDPKLLKSMFFKDIESQISCLENTITVTGIGVEIIGLLPHDTKIIIENIEPYPSEYSEVENKVRTIKGFHYLINEMGVPHVLSYRVKFDSDVIGYAEYCEDIFTLRSTNEHFLKGFLKRYNEMKLDSCRN